MLAFHALLRARPGALLKRLPPTAPSAPPPAAAPRSQVGLGTWTECAVAGRGSGGVFTNVAHYMSWVRPGMAILTLQRAHTESDRFVVECAAGVAERWPMCGVVEQK